MAEMQSQQPAAPLSELVMECEEQFSQLQMSHPQDDMTEAGVKYRTQTLRFQKQDGSREDPREVFAREVLMGLLGLTPATDVVALIQINPDRAYEVSFTSMAKTQEVLAVCKAQAAAPPLRGYVVTGPRPSNYRVVEVTLYNPFIAGRDVDSFLGRYGEVTEPAVKIMDERGYFTAMWRVGMLMKRDPEDCDELAHPPASFDLEGERGTLFYHGQPDACVKCWGMGDLVCHSCGGSMEGGVWEAPRDTEEDEYWSKGGPDGW